MTESLFAERCRDFDENFSRIRERMEKAALSCGRNPEDVTLLAAVKTVPVELINYALKKGLRVIGENRVQEFLEKYDRLLKDQCECQFIGRLQSNKVKYLIGKVTCIQSVDSLKLAKEISRLSSNAGEVTQALVEVNIGREENKGGILPEALEEFLREAGGLPGIQFKGLMAIPPVCEDQGELCRYFSAMFQYYVDMREKKIDNVSMECLSMGMSSDFEEAIRCGATMVRIGSSLFGKRS